MAQGFALSPALTLEQLSALFEPERMVARDDLSSFEGLRLPRQRADVTVHLIGSRGVPARGGS